MLSREGDVGAWVLLCGAWVLLCGAWVLLCGAWVLLCGAWVLLCRPKFVWFTSMILDICIH